MTDLAAWLLAQIAEDENQARAATPGPWNQPMDPDTNWTVPIPHHYDCASYEAAKVLALPYADHPGYREEWRP